MPQRQGVCRVCGEPYAVCMTTGNKSVFNWKEVACSPEHGEEYFRRIRISRGELSPDQEDDQKNSPKNDTHGRKNKPVKNNVVTVNEAHDPEAEIETFFDE